MLKDLTFPQYPVLPTYFVLFPLDSIMLIISYFGCKETSNSHLGKNVSNIGEDFFSLLLLNNFRNVGPTISFLVSITLMTHAVCGAPFTKLPQHLLQLHELKASFFGDTSKPVLSTAWHKIRSCFGKLFETLMPEESHESDSSPASCSS